MTATGAPIISPVNIEARRNLDIKAGDTVRVHQKIQEKGKTRIQIFEGLVIARKHGKEAGATFTVRRVTNGIGVEKIYPLYSPMIDNIEIVRRAKTRRAKLYHIRVKAARAIRREMRRMSFVNLATGSDMEAEAEAKRLAEEEAKAAEEEKTEAEATEEPQAEELSEETKESKPETDKEETKEE